MVNLKVKVVEEKSYKNIFSEQEYTDNVKFQYTTNRIRQMNLINSNIHLEVKQKKKQIFKNHFIAIIYKNAATLL